MSETRTIATIRKNAREEIRVGLQDFKGRQIAAVRVWFQAEDGSMRPGKDGLNFKVELLPELADALAKAVWEAGPRQGAHVKVAPLT